MTPVEIPRADKDVANTLKQAYLYGSHVCPATCASDLWLGCSQEFDRQLGSSASGVNKQQTPNDKCFQNNSAWQQTLTDAFKTTAHGPSVHNVGQRPRAYLCQLWLPQKDD